MLKFKVGHKQLLIQNKIQKNQNLKSNILLSKQKDLLLMKKELEKKFKNKFKKELKKKLNKPKNKDKLKLKKTLKCSSK